MKRHHIAYLSGLAYLAASTFWQAGRRRLRLEEEFQAWCREREGWDSFEEEEDEDPNSDHAGACEIRYRSRRSGRRQGFVVASLDEAETAAAALSRHDIGGYDDVEIHPAQLGRAVLSQNEFLPRVMSQLSSNSGRQICWAFEAVLSQVRREVLCNMRC